MPKIQPCFNKSVYQDNFDHYCAELYPTFSAYFETPDTWRSFLEEFDVSLRCDFMHLAAMYHYLVVNSELKTNGETVDYFDHSNKLLILISLIESAMGRKHRDFYMWLNKKENKSFFPLKRERLGTRYKEYKEYYGTQT